MSSKEKTPKLPKLPKPFARELSQADFDKKILRRIHVEGEKTFARSLYVPGPAGPEGQAAGLVWAAELDRKGMAHLKKLAKEIAKNKGFVQTGRFIILGVLVGLFVGAGFIFKDAWFEDQLEQALEGTFNAQAEIRNLRLDLFGGKVSLDWLEVADQASPMKNLFQMGVTGFSIDTWQLLNRKVVIRRLEAQDLRFGAPRSTSGALPSRPSSPAPAVPAMAPEFAAPGLVDFGKLDPQAILDKEMGNLKSIKAADAVKLELETGLAQWPKDIEAAKSRYDSLSAKTKEVQAIDVGKLKDIASIQAALTKAQALGAEIRTATDEGTTLVKKAQSDYDKATKLIKESSESIAADYAFLGNIIGNPAAYGTGLGTDVARQVLGPQAWQIQAVAADIPRYLKALQDSSPKAPPAEKPARASRLIHFPTATYPDFLLEELAASVWIDDARKASLQVQSVSSDQDLTGKATTFAVEFRDGQLEALLEGAVDVRTSAADQLVVDATVRGIPVSLGDQLAAVGIRDFTALLDAGLRLQLGPVNGTVMGGKGSLVQVRGTVEGQELVDRIGGRILTEASTVTIGLQAAFPPAAEAKVDVSTNVDEIIARVVQETLKDEIERAKAELERLLKAELESRLKENEALYAMYKDYLGSSKGSLTDVNALGKVVDSQTKKLGDAAVKQGKDLVGDKLKESGITLPAVPKVEAPKVTLPKFP